MDTPGQAPLWEPSPLSPSWAGSLVQAAGGSGAGSTGLALCGASTVAAPGRKGWGKIPSERGSRQGLGTVAAAESGCSRVTPAQVHVLHSVGAPGWASWQETESETERGGAVGGGWWCVGSEREGGSRTDPRAVARGKAEARAAWEWTQGPGAPAQRGPKAQPVSTVSGPVSRMVPYMLVTVCMCVISMIHFSLVVSKPCGSCSWYCGVPGSWQTVFSGSCEDVSGEQQHLNTQAQAEQSPP